MNALAAIPPDGIVFFETEDGRRIFNGDDGYWFMLVRADGVRFRVDIPHSAALNKSQRELCELFRNSIMDGVAHLKAL